MMEQSSALRWYYRNRDEQLVKMKAWRDANKRWRTDYQKTYYIQKGKEYFNRLRATWTANNQERTLVNAARRSAKAKGIPFSLAVVDIIIPERCPVLDIKLFRNGGPRTDHSPSLDRIIPERGYIKGNVIVISWRANRLKQDASIEELRKIADFYQLIAAKD